MSESGLTRFNLINPVNPLILGILILTIYLAKA